MNACCTSSIGQPCAHKRVGLEHEWRGQPMPAGSRSTTAWRVSRYAPGSDTPETVLVTDRGAEPGAVVDEAARLANRAYHLGRNGGQYAVKIVTRNNTNGNPERGWLVYSGTGTLAGFHDEGNDGLAGFRARFPAAMVLCEVQVLKKEYRIAKAREREGE